MYRLILTRGIITLHPLPLGQTEFTFSSEVKIKSTQGDSEKSPNPSTIFKKLSTLFYTRFEQKNIIDARKHSDFVKNINQAPKITEPEIKLVKESMRLAEECKRKAKRVQGTINDSVEKVSHQSKCNFVFNIY